MVYIAGQARPKKVHKTIESAKEDVEKYRSEGGQRGVYILTPIEYFPTLIPSKNPPVTI
jgi:hypothetical protein